MSIEKVIESSEPVDQEILHDLKNKSSFKESAKYNNIVKTIIEEAKRLKMNQNDKKYLILSDDVINYLDLTEYVVNPYLSDMANDE